MSLKLLANKYIELNVQDIRELNGEVDTISEDKIKNYIFLFCRFGSIDIILDGEKRVLKESDVLFVKIGHSINILKGSYSCILVSFNGSAVEDLIFNTVFAVSNSVVKDTNSHLGYYFYKIYHAYYECGNVSIKCLGILYELFYEITKNNKKTIENLAIKEKHINNAKEFINKYYNKEITILDVAKAVGVTSNYLSNIFALYTNSTPKEYLTFVRMEQAKKLLLTEKYKIKEVGALVGYKNQLHFSGEFKKYTGIAPLHYIKEFIK